MADGCCEFIWYEKRISIWTGPLAVFPTGFPCNLLCECRGFEIKNRNWLLQTKGCCWTMAASSRKWRNHSWSDAKRRHLSQKTSGPSYRSIEASQSPLYVLSSAEVLFPSISRGCLVLLESRRRCITLIELCGRDRNDSNEVRAKWVWRQPLPKRDTDPTLAIW
jgi:hypothetical protein